MQRREAEEWQKQEIDDWKREAMEWRKLAEEQERKLVMEKEKRSTENVKREVEKQKKKEAEEMRRGHECSLRLMQNRKVCVVACEADTWKKRVRVVLKDELTGIEGHEGHGKSYEDSFYISYNSLKDKLRERRFIDG